MGFLRRFFYNLGDGGLLYAYRMQGDFAYCPAEQDAAQNNLTDYGVLEWTTPDPVIEAQFADPYNNHVTVDVAADPPALVFGHVDAPGQPPMEDLADMAAALALLGVEPVAGEGGNGGQVA